MNASGGVAGAVALSGASAAAKDQDPDELFRQGWFREADRGYRRLVREDPNNAHALARRGYIALLSNEFEAAETFLTRAIELAPRDTFSKLQLADTFVRQDQLARAVPLLQGLGETERAWAVSYASISGTPYDVHGADSTTVPFPALDPMPHFELSVNGMEPQRFIFDTGATLNLTKETAQRAGLVGLATSHTFAAGQQLTLTHGVADSIRIGEVELRNVPVTWPDQMRLPELPDGTLPAGVVGTDIFYRFLTTLDYAGRGLVLRRKTTTELRRFRAEAARAGAEVLPIRPMSASAGSVPLRGDRRVRPRVPQAVRGDLRLRRHEPLHHRRTQVGRAPCKTGVTAGRLSGLRGRQVTTRLPSRRQPRRDLRLALRPLGQERMRQPTTSSQTPRSETTAPQHGTQHERRHRGMQLTEAEGSHGITHPGDRRHGHPGAAGRPAAAGCRGRRPGAQPAQPRGQARDRVRDR